MSKITNLLTISHYDEIGKFKAEIENNLINLSEEQLTNCLITSFDNGNTFKIASEFANNSDLKHYINKKTCSMIWNIIGINGNIAALGFILNNPIYAEHITEKQKKEVFTNAYKHGNLEIVKWAIEQGKIPKKVDIITLVKDGNFHIIKHFYEKKLYLNIIDKNFKEFLYEVIDKYTAIKPNTNVEFVIENTSVDKLKKVWNSQMFERLVTTKRLNVIEDLENKGVKLDYNFSYRSSSYSDFANFIYARGEVETLEFLEKRKVLSFNNIDYFETACNSNNYDVVKYLISNKHISIDYMEINRIKNKGRADEEMIALLNYLVLNKNVPVIDKKNKMSKI